MAVRLLTKKAFRFTKPAGEGSISKPKLGETPEEAAKRFARDAATALSNASSIQKHKEHFFDVQPGIVTDCPDWIKQDDIFQWAVNDGDIMELVPVGKATATPAMAQGELVLPKDGDELIAFVKTRGYSDEAAKGIVARHADEVRADMKSSAEKAASLSDQNPDKNEDKLTTKEEARVSAALALGKEQEKAKEEKPEEEKFGPVEDKNPVDNQGVQTLPGGARRKKVMGGS